MEEVTPMPVVKRVQSWIPQADLSTKIEYIPVSFSAKTGLFSMAVPDHIAAVVFGPNKWGEKRMGKRGKVLSEVERVETQHVHADNIEGVERNLKKVLEEYESILTTKMRRKIIIVTFRTKVCLNYGDAKKAGIPTPDHTECTDRENTPKSQWSDSYVLLRKENLSFAESPALELTYHVCYVVADTLYDIESMERLGRLNHENRDDSAVVLDWTEDRERFFEEARLGLLKTIHMIDSFIENVRADPAKLDAWIAKRPLLSGATSEVEDEH
jgi:hypothetical protein